MLGLVLCDVVYDGLQRERAAGVWSEGVLSGGDDVVLGEVSHELLVDDGVEELGDDGEERDRSVVHRQGSVFRFVQFDRFRQFERVDRGIRSRQ